MLFVVPATFFFFCCGCLQRRKHMLLSSAAGEIDVQKEEEGVKYIYWSMLWSNSKCVLAVHQGVALIRQRMSTNDFVFIRVDKYDPLTRGASISLIKCVGCKLQNGKD